MAITAREDRKIINGDRSAAFREEPVRTEPCPRRIRARFNGRIVADSTAVLYVFERDHLPVYYFPLADVDQKALVRSERTTHCSRKGDATYWSLKVGDREATDAVWGYERPLDEIAQLRDHVAIYWNQIDHWYEEDDEVFVHARDPYNRVDALRSSRSVRVEVDGVVLAETTRPTLVFETGLPTRYYIPQEDVELELLRDSDTRTACPYKGRARYFSAQLPDRVANDIAWVYDFPIPEAPKLEQLIAFYDEHVDTWVDGVASDRPVSNWS